MVKETDLPKAVPTETEEPDRVVTTNDAKKPEKDEQEVAAVQTSGLDGIGRCRSHGNAELRSHSGRPALGRARAGHRRSARRMRATWTKELVAHLDKHKRYPAERQQKTAEIIVSFVLDRTGHVISTSIVKGSGDTAFDEAALAMVRRSDPVPQPPPLVADEGLNFTLPVIFRVKGKS